MHGIDSTRQKFDVDIRTRFRLIVFSIIPYNQQSRYNRIISITITADLADANLDPKPKFLSTARQKSRPRFKRRTNVHLLSLYTYSVACHQPFLQGRSWHCQPSQYLCQHMRRHYHWVHYTATPPKMHPRSGDSFKYHLGRRLCFAFFFLFFFTTDTLPKAKEKYVTLIRSALIISLKLSLENKHFKSWLKWLFKISIFKD